MVVLHCVISAVLLAISNNMSGAQAFNVMDYSHYLDYLPYRQEGLVAFEDFRTAPYPPLHLRNRKMDTGAVKLSVEIVRELNVWPANWPFGPEDFRPMETMAATRSSTRCALPSPSPSSSRTRPCSSPASCACPFAATLSSPRKKQGDAGGAPAGNCHARRNRARTV